MADMRQGRQNHACTVVEVERGAMLVVAGGYNSGDHLRLVQLVVWYTYRKLFGTDLITCRSSSYMMVDTGKWVDAGNLQFQRSARPGLVTLGGRVVILGGSGSGDDELDSVEELDLVEMKWRLITGRRMKIGRSNFSGTVVKKSMVCK